jgi:hypothetical protein
MSTVTRWTWRVAGSCPPGPTVAPATGDGHMARLGSASRPVRMQVSTLIPLSTMSCSAQVHITVL